MLNRRRFIVVYVQVLDVVLTPLSFAIQQRGSFCKSGFCHNVIVKCSKKDKLLLKAQQPSTQFAKIRERAATTSNLRRLLIPQFNLKEEAKVKNKKKHEQVVRVQNYERNVAALENSRVHVCVVVVVCLFLFCFRKNPTRKVLK